VQQHIDPPSDIARQKKRDKKTISSGVIVALLMCTLLAGFAAGAFFIGHNMFGNDTEFVTSDSNLTQPVVSSSDNLPQATPTPTSEILIPEITLTPEVVATPSTRIEGPGFASAAGAVIAYLDALREADLYGMISTFAIESYVENFDLEANIVRLGVFLPFGVLSGGHLPPTNHFMTSVAMQTRQARVTQQIMFQYATLFFPHLIGENTSLDEDNTQRDAQRIVSELADPAHIDALMSMRFLSFVSLENVDSQVFQNYISESNQENIRRDLDILGAQRHETVIARVEIGNEVYLLFYEVVAYGNNWFIRSLNGSASTLLGLAL
jgi:hypothetical protein